MNVGEWQEKVLGDINERSLLVAGFIAVDTDGKLQYISYDVNGLVSHITSPYPAIDLYGKDSGDTKAMTPLTCIVGIKPVAKSSVTKLEIVE